MSTRKKTTTMFSSAVESNCAAPGVSELKIGENIFHSEKMLPEQQRMDSGFGTLSSMDTTDSSVDIPSSSSYIISESLSNDIRTSKATCDVPWEQYRETEDEVDEGCLMSGHLTRSIEPLPPIIPKTPIEPSRCNEEIETKPIQRADPVTPHLTHFEQDDEGDNHLHLAIIHKNEAWTFYIISECVSASFLDIQNNIYQTVLHLAVLTGQYQVVRKLVVCGASLDIKNQNGDTALHLACKRGDIKCVLALVTPITQEDAMNSPYPLPYRMIPQDQSVYNFNGNTCLHIAFMLKHYDIVKVLLNSNANINLRDGTTGRTILHCGVIRNDKEFVTWLTENPNLQVDARTFGEQTPLQIAKMCKLQGIMSVLKNAGADLETIDGEFDDISCSDDSDLDFS